MREFFRSIKERSFIKKTITKLKTVYTTVYCLTSYILSLLLMQKTLLKVYEYLSKAEIQSLSLLEYHSSHDVIYRISSLARTTL